MANIKVSSITKKEPPCPGPAPKKPKKFQPAPTDAPGAFPPPPPFFMPGPCCPSTTQVVDNITVVSTTPETIEVQEGTCQGMKAYGVGAKTFAGVGTSGMVPVPQPGDENKVLAGDGTWAEIIIQQSDWEQEDDAQPDFIKNKPDIEAMITVETVRAETAEIAATTEVKAGENATVDEEIAPDGHHIYTVNADGKPQVQADWDQTNTSAKDFIKNKPKIPDVPSWAMQPTKPSYSASEVGALPSSTQIPSKTSDLTNDSGFLTQHQSLANYEKKMGIIANPSLVGNTLAIPVSHLGSYYKLDVSAPTTITLPDMANETVMTIVGVIVNIMLSTGGSLTLTATQPIYENGLSDIEEGGTFEINAIYNGSYWAVTATKLELYNPS